MSLGQDFGKEVGLSFPPTDRDCMRNFDFDGWKTERDLLFPFLQNLQNLPELIHDKDRFQMSIDGFNKAILFRIPDEMQKDLVDNWFRQNYLEPAYRDLEQTIWQSLNLEHRIESDPAAAEIRVGPLADRKLSEAFYEWAYWLAAAETLRDYVSDANKTFDFEKNSPIEPNIAERMKPNKLSPTFRFAVQAMGFVHDDIGIFQLLGPDQPGIKFPELLKNQIIQTDPIGQMSVFSEVLSAGLMNPACRPENTIIMDQCVRITDDSQKFQESVNNSWLPGALNRAIQKSFLDKVNDLRAERSIK
jgi:hypothetical protein